VTIRFFLDTIANLTEGVSAGMSNFLINGMDDARKRTLCLIDGLSPEQLIGPTLSSINPLRWEIGHAAYFYEFWILRSHLGNAPILEKVDDLYDSINIAHDERWKLPLPEMEATLAYMKEVHDRIKRNLKKNISDPKRDYLLEYSIYHEDMHTEAYTYTRQTLGYPTPAMGQYVPNLMRGTEVGDVSIPGGTFMLGAFEDSGFVFDNEKWAHEREVKSFSISKSAVSNYEYISFVEDGGYENKTFWDDEGLKWLKESKLHSPCYWRASSVGWEMRHFDQWRALEPDAAVIHVNWHEAKAYCNWKNRRLPTELEWEVAASGKFNEQGGLSLEKNFYPWGSSEINKDLANLDGCALGTIAVGALPDGDSEFGCRQMIGNVWEWTEDTFHPYPGFESDMYEDYSKPLFGNTKVLRGGSWVTRGRMIRNTWRTFQRPERNDVFSGFRTCPI
tara:strand:- start:17395 stop:18735 length:1341 start_codon:yes stop_codon:yes gene_type:complete